MKIITCKLEYGDKTYAKKADLQKMKGRVVAEGSEGVYKVFESDIERADYVMDMLKRGLLRTLKKLEKREVE